MRSLFTSRSFAALTIVVIVAALLAVWDRHGAGIAAQGTPASVASPVGPGDGNAEDIHVSNNGTPTSGSLPSKPDQPVKARVSEAFGKLPLSFEANDGQVDRQVKFFSRGSGYNLFLTSNEAVLSLSKSDKQSRHQAAASRKAAKSHLVRERAVVRMKLVGGNPAPQVRGLDELSAKTNYFIGADPSKWRSVSNFAKVEYKNVYPGIDLVYYGNQRQLEYDFVIAPGADPGAIKLAFAGTERLRIDGEGALALRTAGGELCMRKPVVYQEVNGGRKIVEGNYALSGAREVRFEVADYDPSRPLVIDPVLSYSTYIGGGGADLAEDIAVDSSGNAYITGTVYPAAFSYPIVNAYQTVGDGNYDAFVTKINPAGNVLLYSTYLGGNRLDNGWSIAADSSGNAYVTGSTSSWNFPTKNAYQAAKQDGSDFLSDCFVTKLNTNLSGAASLIYSTYLGGFSNETGYGIAADSSGYAYVTGSTISSNFPTLNAFQGFQSREDAFVTKLNTNASGTASLLYSTFLGGVGESFFDGDECGNAIASDSSGNVYVTGYTTSNNFPTKNAYQSNHFAYQDVFVTKLNTNASGAASLLYSTYLSGYHYLLYGKGEGGVEAGYGIAADASGIAYVTGYTDTPNFPTKNAYQPTHMGGALDVFVTKLDTNACGANSLLYSTFLGGTAPYNNSEIGYGIAADSLGNAYVTGFTLSTDFPAKNSLYPHRGGNCGIEPCADVFVTKLNTNVAGAAGLVYSTFIGGSHDDRGFGIAIDSSGNAYVTGRTDSTNFPANNPDPDTNFIGADTDLFVLKLSDPASAPPPDADGDGVADANDICPGTPAGVTVDANGCPVSCAAPPAGMVGWWPGDGSANDIKGSNHGALQNGATFGTGKVGQAFSFDGVDDYASAPFTQTGPFTVDLWAKANVGCQSEFRSLLASAYPGNFPENTFQIDFDGAGNYRFRATGASTLHLTIGPASVNFQHIAVTYDGSVVRTYRNGQLTNSGTWTGAALTFTTLRIGMNRGDGAPFNGLVDEVEVFNRALSQSEIQAIAKAGSAGKCKNRAPVALCQNVTVSAGPSCTAIASINNGSSDPDGNPIIITQSPPGPYPLGTTSVTMTVTDSNGASSSCSATVTVTDNTPPTITAPPAVNVSTGPSATGCGMVISDAALGSATASDNCGGATITRSSLPAGNFFPVGTTYITYTANDGRGNTATALQAVTVTDTTPPAPDLATLPDATGQCSATISAAPTATDYCRGSVTGTTTDPLTYTSQGTFTVTWTFNDGNGNTLTQTQRVVVRDTAAPGITTANKTVNTDLNLCSAVVAHGTTASDNCALASLVGVRNDGAALTAPYPKGTTTINWTAMDQAGNTSIATQTITVIDNQQPLITACATNKTVSANAVCQAAIPSLTGEVSATDNCTTSSALTITQTPAAGTLVGLGATSVTITVKDAAGNMSTCAVTVNVVDATPPTVTSSVTEASLWPSNHNLINVGLAVSRTDNCTPNSTVQVLVYSDEDDDEETGDGNHSPDAKDLAPGSLRLRSERNGNGDGRVYLIVVKATDAAGNVGFACSTVVVPKSQSQSDRNAVNAQAAAAKAYFQANGAPPSGYFVVGDGPVIGPKQ